MTGPCEVAKGAPGTPFLAKWVLRAYPSWWRERYGEDQEMFVADLAADRRPLRRAVADLALGAVRARLHPVGMPKSVPAWRDRTQASVAWATVPALAALLLITAVTGHSYSMWSGPSIPFSTGGRVGADAMAAMSWASIATVVLLLIGWALVARLAERVPRGRAGVRWLLLITAPFLAMVLEIGLTLVQHWFARSSGYAVVNGHGVVRAAHPLAASVASVAWDVVAVAGLLSIFCVVLAARRAELEVDDLRAGVWLAELTALLLFVVALASVAWGIAVTHQPPIALRTSSGPGRGFGPGAGYGPRSRPSGR